MLNSRLGRAIIVFLLLILLFGLLIWFGSLEPNPSVWALPSAEQLADDYDRHLGERVTVVGTVVETDPVFIEAEYGRDGVIRLHIVGLGESTEVTKGDRLNVYGIAREDQTVYSLNAVVVPRSGLWYTWSVSFSAGLWMLGRVVQHWRVDRQTWAIRRRSAPFRVGPWLRSRFTGVSEDA